MRRRLANRRAFKPQPAKPDNACNVFDTVIKWFPGTILKMVFAKNSCAHFRRPFCNAADNTAWLIIFTLFIGHAGSVYGANQQAQLASTQIHHQLLQQASIYQQKGFRKRALPLLFEAQKVAKKLSSADQTASALALGRLYFELGEYPLSLQQLQSITGSNRATYPQAVALNTIATIHSTLNAPKDASIAFRAAYELANKIDHQTLQLTILTNQLRHQLAYNKKTAVSTTLPLSWKIISQLPADLIKAELNISLATLYLRAVQQSKAEQTWLQRGITLLDQANVIARQQDDARLQSYALGFKAKLLTANDQSLDAALAIAQSAVFLANSIQAYDSAYLWEWQIAKIHQQQSRDGLAIASYYQAIRTLEQVRKELIDGSPFTFHQKVQPLFTELADLLLTTATSASLFDKQSYLKSVQDLLEQSKSAELQDYFQNDCVIPDQTVNLDQIESATAVIYPIILPERLAVLVNIDQEIYQFVSPVNVGELESLVNEFREHLQEDLGDEEYLELGEELYQLIFAQIEPLFKTNDIDTLLVIPDGVLRTVPISALYDGEQFLVQRFAIATTPGINLTLPKPLDIGEARLFAGGISEAVQGFVGLPGVPQELTNLQDNYGAEVLQDKSFKSTDLAGQLASADFSIVHIATHGHFDSNPQKSYLLTYDGKLTLDRLEDNISHRKNIGEPLELLVLSACETAAGDSRAALGLAGVALKAGARSAVATLWQISDAATVQIIDKFYNNISKQGLSKAKALQQAQVELINQPRFQHPTDWAPFLMIGNWL
ncbi:MAG: CHAT domain-containing protein [Pseudomonadales bacterium]|nr:CHAT domain-containing protein [Pseudomonadales bacterium]